MPLVTGLRADEQGAAAVVATIGQSCAVGVVEVIAPPRKGVAGKVSLGAAPEGRGTIPRKRSKQRQRRFERAACLPVPEHEIAGECESVALRDSLVAAVDSTIRKWAASKVIAGIIDAAPKLHPEGLVWTEEGKAGVGTAIRDSRACLGDAVGCGTEAIAVEILKLRIYLGGGALNDAPQAYVSREEIGIRCITGGPGNVPFPRGSGVNARIVVNHAGGVEPRDAIHLTENSVGLIAGHNPESGVGESIAIGIGGQDAKAAGRAVRPQGRERPWAGR